MRWKHAAVPVLGTLVFAWQGIVIAALVVELREAKATLHDYRQAYGMDGWTIFQVGPDGDTTWT